MENLETGKDKIKKICEVLKQETLIPAQQESQQILEAAQEEAMDIIKNGEKKAEEIRTKAKLEMEKERELFESSMKQAASQTLENLRQEIEKKFFNVELVSWVNSAFKDPEVSAKLINTLVGAIEKEGTSADFSAIVPDEVPAAKINALLLENVLEKLKENSVVVGDFHGGVKIKLHDRRMTLDLSDEAMIELIGQYIRKDFRKLLYGADNEG